MRHLKNEKGSTLTIVVVIVSLLLISSSFLLSTYVKSSQSVNSQEKIMKSTYLAEAGLVEAIDTLYDSLDAIENSGGTTATPLPIEPSTEGDAEKEHPACSNSNGNAGIKNPHCQSSALSVFSVIKVSNSTHPSCDRGNAGIKNPHCQDDEEVPNVPPAGNDHPSCDRGNAGNKNPHCQDDKEPVVTPPAGEHPSCDSGNAGNKNPHCQGNEGQIPEPENPLPNPSEDGVQIDIPSCQKETTHHNPYCIDFTSPEWDPTYEGSSEGTVPSYKGKGEYSWFVEGIKEKRTYYIQSIGTYGNAKTTLETGLFINSENKIVILFTKEI